MLARLRSRGVEFVPASGRQYATLRAMFADKAAQVLDGGELSYIAENGNVVAIDGNIAEVHGVDTDVIRWTIDTVNASAAAGEYDMGLVLCGLRTAYVQRTDKPFLDEVGKYYAALEIVDDLHSVLEDVIASNGDSRFRRCRSDGRGKADATEKRLSGGGFRQTVGRHHECYNQ